MSRIRKGKRSTQTRATQYHDVTQPRNSRSCVMLFWYPASEMVKWLNDFFSLSFNLPLTSHYSYGKLHNNTHGGPSIPSHLQDSQTFSSSPPPLPAFGYCKRGSQASKASRKLVLLKPNQLLLLFWINNSTFPKSVNSFKIPSFFHLSSSSLLLFC